MKLGNAEKLLLFYYWTVSTEAFTKWVRTQMSLKSSPFPLRVGWPISLCLFPSVLHSIYLLYLYNSFPQSRDVRENKCLVFQLIPLETRIISYRSSWVLFSQLREYLWFICPLINYKYKLSLLSASHAIKHYWFFFLHEQFSFHIKRYFLILPR